MVFEYEVAFIYGSVNVVALAYVGEGDDLGGETMEQVAIRRAADTVAEDLGITINSEADYDDVWIKQTRQIGGNNNG